MKNVAAHFAAQKLKPSKATDKELAAQGQKIYRAGSPASGMAACAGCHGPTGAGIPSQYPRIAGQFPEYVEAQLKAFRSGARANDPNSMMRSVAARMSDKDIQAVAQYVAGLR
jgi:cytochrome c553